ncbi:MAG: CAP domain-containing protein [Candidatus Viridilinea halotolerans]|uniref:CAP domain-containing protein n=1 Tax=Candidatus Viridilinea halotolerans TaxID=2491704 RepID=A0A426TR34_9CHLR|nr:MAG: CAP domain-containing protein [Candidatus Viridilinea halotolerans]
MLPFAPWFRHGALLVLLGLLTILLPSHPVAAQSGSRCFAETGFCIEGAIRDYWERNGGLAVFGFPKSAAAREQVEGRELTVQWFERDRLEIQPDGRVTAGRLGARLLELQGTPWQRGPGEAGGNGCLAFGETGHRTCGAFASYWERNGGLERFGFPLTGAFETTIEGRQLTVQYFERRRFELHSNNQVLLGLLGNEVLARQGSTPGGPPPVTPTPAPPSVQLPTTWLERVNAYRAIAGVPPVTEDATLSANCVEHARYMAENRDLTHDQNPSLPWASAAGQICAEKGNAWIGSGRAWQPHEAIDGWMTSVGHRLWLLYPTTPTFGFGFYSAGQTSAAALDVLSRSNTAADGSFTGWPVRYPVANQTNVAPRAMPVTLLWPYFEAVPVLTASELRTAAGVAIGHQATTSLPVGHKGIAIIPDVNLPANTEIYVRIQGSYKDQAFDLAWSFSTGQ